MLAEFERQVIVSTQQGYSDFAVLTMLENDIRGLLTRRYGSPGRAIHKR
jgi:hypothetical protein